MSKIKKMVFPKIKKKIKNLIIDESWNITEKSWLVIWATWAIALWLSIGLNEVSSASNIACSDGWICWKLNSWHFNWNTNWHYNWSQANYWASITPTPKACDAGLWHYNSSITPINCNPISWVINWHYNITPTCSSSHANHCNHISSWDSWDWWDGWDSCG